MIRCSAVSRAIQSAPDFVEAARDPNWCVAAHGDHFETAMSAISWRRATAGRWFRSSATFARRRRCLAVGLPAKLGAAADALELENRKDADGERLMHQMAKPRRRARTRIRTISIGSRTGAAASGSANMQARRRSRARAHTGCRRCRRRNRRCGCSAARSTPRLLRRSRLPRPRGGLHAAAPDIDAELAELTGGPITGVNQVARLLQCCRSTATVKRLDRKAIERQLDKKNYRQRCSACSSFGSVAPRLPSKRSTPCSPGWRRRPRAWRLPLSRRRHRSLVR